MNATLVVSCAMGLETVLKFELFDLGFKDLSIENGAIKINAQLTDVCTFNLWCRTAGRVFIEIDQFNATSFDELFESISNMNWAQWLPKDAKCTIDSVSSKHSELFSKSDIQAVAKKAIISSLEKAYNTKQFSETGAHVPVRIAIDKNVVSIRLDTSGHGLNKRGYRSRFDAPLRETLAAALIKLSRWDPANDVLIDPFCGSGTILIEAGMIANTIAPGLKQQFCSEDWPIFPPNAWSDARAEATAKINPIPYRIYGSDKNPDILKTARYNIDQAGLSDIFVETKDVKDLRSRFDKGKIICNPPYGIRLEEMSATQLLYTQLAETLQTHFQEWHYYVLTADEEFESYFDRNATKKRKLFNGKIRCDYYQYF